MVGVTLPGTEGLFCLIFLVYVRTSESRKVMLAFILRIVISGGGMPVGRDVYR